MSDLRLSLDDVKGRPIGGLVDIVLINQITKRKQGYNGVDASGNIKIPDIVGGAHGSYRIEVTPQSHAGVGHYVSVGASGTTEHRIVFPVDRSKVKGIAAPAFDELPEDTRQLLTNSHQVRDHDGLSGVDLYDGLIDQHRAGMLNITAKSAATTLNGGATVLSLVRELVEVRGDRIFARASGELRRETSATAETGSLKGVSGSLHEAPEGYKSDASFKTKDRYGNLQLTFFKHPEDDDDYVVDIDIDDAGGFEHVFQVLRNWITRGQTHPYDIQQILLFHQDLDPGYDLLV